MKKQFRLHSLVFFLATIPIFLFSRPVSAQTSVEEIEDYIRNGEYDRARSSLASLVESDPTNARAQYWFGRLLFTMYNDLDRAAEHLKLAVEYEEGNAEYHWMLGNVFGRQAQEASIFSQMSLAGDVKEQFERAVELDSNDVRFRTSLMQFYVQAPGIIGGSIERALIQADAIYRIDPYAGHAARALIATAEDDLPMAEEEWKKAIAVDTTRWTAFHRLGYLYLQLGRGEESIPLFQKYVAIAPDDANSYDSLGDGYFAAGQFDSALVQYRTSLSINPQFAVSAYNAGRCYEQKGMVQEAIEAYNYYLANAPDGPYAETAREKIEDLEP
jgi:tetratricopeptide (TPR) repeat protein